MMTCAALDIWDFGVVWGLGIERREWGIRGLGCGVMVLGIVNMLRIFW